METKEKTVIAQGAKTGKNDASVVVMRSKPVLNLDETTKVIAELWKLQKHRVRLMTTLDNLIEFDTKIDEESNLERVGYSQCQLYIQGGNGKKFETRTPILIGDVIEYIKLRCQKRLGEVESEIILPN